MPPGPLASATARRPPVAGAPAPLDFEALWPRYAPALSRCVRRLVPNPADAEDILQEVALSVFLHLPEFRGESSLPTWLSAIARNQALSFFRKRRLTTLPLEAVQSATRPAPPDPGPSPLEAILACEHTRLWRRRLARLSAPNRAALDLLVWADLTNEEIAARLGLSVGTVKGRIHRARAALTRRPAHQPES